jgi:hypothetical protein
VFKDTNNRGLGVVNDALKPSTVFSGTNGVVAVHEGGNFQRIAPDEDFLFILNMNRSQQNHHMQTSHVNVPD